MGPETNRAATAMGSTERSDRRARPRCAMRRSPARLLPALVLAASVANLGGCAVGPDFSRPAAPAARQFVHGQAVASTMEAEGVAQTFAAQTSLPSDWWRLFGSPAVDAAVDNALKSNATIRASEAALRQSEEQMRAGAGVFYPQINAAANAQRERFAPIQMGLPTPPYLFSLYTVSASVSYALDIWGGERRALEALRAQVDVQRYIVLATYLTLTSNVVNAEIARAAYSDEIIATRETTQLLRRQVSLTEAQVHAGTSAYPAVLTLENQLATLQASLPALEQKRVQAEDLLATLSGTYPSLWHEPDLSLAAIRLPAALPDTVPSELVGRRPDILQAEALLHIASANIGIATANMLPNLTLSASGGFAGAAIGSMFSRGNVFGNLAAGMTAPVFRGGALQSQREAAIDAYRASNAIYEQTVLAAFAQVADSLRALQNDAVAVEAQSRAVASARETLNLIKADYQEGTVDYLQILTADEQYHQSRIAELQAVAQRLQDTVALYVALGGGWREADRDPIPNPQTSSEGAAPQKERRFRQSETPR